MALTAGELAQIVWAETRLMGIGLADGTGAVNGARRLVAQLAASSGGLGFERREPLPAINDQRYGDSVRALMAIVDQAKNASAPQSRLIVWPAGEDPSKLNLTTDRPPPKPWSSTSADSIANQLRFELRNGSTFDIFSRAATLVGGADGAPLVNALTGTGLPDGKPLALSPAMIAKGFQRGIPWLMGIIGVLLFIVGGAMSAISGLSMSGARNSLVSTDLGYQQLFLTEMATLCVNERQSFPSEKQAGVCEALLGGATSLTLPEDADKIVWTKADDVLNEARKCSQEASGPSCALIWRAAVATDQDQVWKKYYFGWMYATTAYLTGLSSDTGSTSIVVPYIITLVGAAGLLVALGLSTKGRIAGIWIDTRNRVSLARAQVTLWTVVVLGGYLALAMFNVGFAGILQSPEALTSYHAFPSIPASVAAALGIATTSTMLSTLILGTKDKEVELNTAGDSQDATSRGAAFFGAQTTGLDKRASPAGASLADVFMGEENSNSDTVDVARLQNVMITIILVFGFFSFLLEWMSDIKMVTMLNAHDAIFQSLPQLGATFTSLLGLSHATYLVSKAHDARE
ncbi:hypothetical protein RZS28_03920 [Methylocapsa polymorpha]|uniref:Transmembrane protein n=1 Tax=Methylocapsa polymorpha TaxID=3080828 RepID=A0ABZ0HUR5_9HYPH|nr:hypothetical protein RZS28_03920 [Methylocapsa sp. RX1]